MKPRDNGVGEVSSEVGRGRASLRVVGWALRVALTCAVLVTTRAASGADPSFDATQGCIKPSERGQSQRDEGKYRAARQSFIQCSRDLCPTVLLKMCMGWLQEIDQTAPTLVLGARDEQGHDVADVTVSFDGEPLTSRLDGRPIEVDTGEHVLRFEREHSLPVEEKLILRAGERARVVTVTFQSDTPSQPTPPRDVETPAAAPAPVAWPRHVTAGAMLLGAVGAGGTGLYFLLAASHDRQNATQMRSVLGFPRCLQHVDVAGVPEPCRHRLRAAHRLQRSDGLLRRGRGPRGQLRRDLACLAEACGIARRDAGADVGLRRSGARRRGDVRRREPRVIVTPEVAREQPAESGTSSRDRA